MIASSQNNDSLLCICMDKFDRNSKVVVIFIVTHPDNSTKKESSVSTKF